MQKKVPYVAQLGNMDCSIACMTMLFRYYGLDVDIVDVGQVVHIGRDGVNLTQLKQATQQFGFKCTAYRYNKQKNILDSNLPAVVYSGSHLAVIGSKTVLGQYILLDPIKGKSIVNFEQIHDTFSDILITIRPEKRIKRKKCKPKLKVAINYKLVAGIISVHHEYTVALLGKGNAQVVRGSRFARTALLVCDSNSFHLVSSSKISSKLIQCF